MTTPLQKPNTDQANEDNLSGQTKELFKKWLREEVDDCLPARVVSYDDTTNRAVIQPVVMIGTTDGSKVSRAQIANIPVFRFGGGGMFIRFPLKAGDLGWLKANDRDISLIMQSGGGEEWPNTVRLHSFSDALFFPDTLKAWIIDGANTENAVWQTLDGKTCIALGESGIELKRELAKVNITDDSVRIQRGAVSWTLDDSGIDMIGPPGGLRYNGVNVGDTHTHIGPQTAPPGPVSNTGTPNP